VTRRASQGATGAANVIGDFGGDFGGDDYGVGFFASDR
jgi:hypothetical protein